MRGLSTAWQFFVPFMGWLSDLLERLSDLQLGDQKVTLNHLEGRSWKKLFRTEPMASFHEILTDDMVAICEFHERGEPQINKQVVYIGRFFLCISSICLRFWGVHLLFSRFLFKLIP